LRDATTLGVGALHFVATERSDPDYAAATLWTSGEWRRHRLAGAAEAFATRLPQVTSDRTLATALAALPTPHPTPCPRQLRGRELPFRFVTYQVANRSCSRSAPSAAGARPTAALRAHGFTLSPSRIARARAVETAVIAAVTLVRAKLGLI